MIRLTITKRLRTITGAGLNPRVFTTSSTKPKQYSTLVLLILSSIYSSLILASPNPGQHIDKVYDILLNVPDGEQDEPIEYLLEDAIAFRNDHPESVEIWIACALAHLVYAGDRINPTQQLRYLKLTRKELETAVKIDKQALGGLATAYLGLVYNTAPPWPLSYGSKRKAEKLLQEALVIDPESMTNNAFYASFLIQKKEYTKAKLILEHIKTLAPLDSETPNWNSFLSARVKNSNDAIKSKMNLQE